MNKPKKEVKNTVSIKRVSGNKINRPEGLSNEDRSKLLKYETIDVPQELFKKIRGVKIALDIIDEGEE